MPAMRVRERYGLVETPARGALCLAPGPEGDTPKKKAQKVSSGKFSSGIGQWVPFE